MGKKQKKIVFPDKEKQLFKEYLDKILSDIAHNDYFDKNKKVIGLNDWIDKEISIGQSGFFYFLRLSEYLSKTRFVDKNYSNSSVSGILKNVIKQIHKKLKLSSKKLKEKVLSDYIEKDTLEKEIEKIESFLNANENIKKWTIIAPFYEIGLKGIDSINIGKCNVFIMDEERKKKFIDKENEYSSFFPFSDKPAINEGSVYMETSSIGYHGGKFEASKVSNEAIKNFKDCQAAFKLIVRLFKIKSKYWLPWTNSYYWCYVYAENNEKSGSNIHIGDELIFSKETFDITKEHIEKFRKSYPFENINKLLINVNPSGIEKRILRALEWFSSGFSETNISHKFIQYCVSLDSLLGKKDIHTPVSIALAEKVAFLMTKNKTDRIKWRNYIKTKILGLRGKVLHSGHSLTTDDMDTLYTLESAVIFSIVQILRKIDTVKNDKDLDDYFDNERFFPSPSPEMIKQLEETRKEINSISKKSKAPRS